MNERVLATSVGRVDYERRSGDESSASAVSWGAVISGAVVAAALSLILLALGSGLGLSSVSPWENAGASAKTIGIATVIWLALMQIIAAATGGYMAGRLRTKWVDVHDDEVFFRDTAHGFLAWAVATVVTAALLTSTASSLVGTTAKVGATALGAGVGTGIAAAPSPQAPNTEMTPVTPPATFLVDRILRTDRPTADGAATTAAAPSSGPADAQVRAELARVFTYGMTDGALAPADRAYVAQIIAARTGIPQADAEKRVDAAVAQAKHAADEAKAAADTARKAAAWLSLWVFISLLIGAFSASYAATFGGRLRDRIAV